MVNKFHISQSGLVSSWEIPCSGESSNICDFDIVWRFDLSGVTLFCFVCSFLFQLFLNSCAFGCISLLFQNV
ncbi:hypothetical protein Fmac_016478 [Flemingia macrophylla]|uniref:Uncharacterized protein n=1 Tax=Flemingia macrophylla TaxID=520843 RepID=A0ABD1MHH5_9FABA